MIRLNLRRYLASLDTRGYARRTIARKASVLRRDFGWARRTARFEADLSVRYPPVALRLGAASLTVEWCGMAKDVRVAGLPAEWRAVGWRHGETWREWRDDDRRLLDVAGACRTAGSAELGGSSR